MKIIWDFRRLSQVFCPCITTGQEEMKKDFASGRGYDKKLGSIPYVKEHGDLNMEKKKKLWTARLEKCGSDEKSQNFWYRGD